MVEELTNENFEEKVKEGNVVVDFFATWCGPCKMMMPVFEEVAGEIDDVKFYTVNIEEADQAAQKFGVTSIPTFIFFKDGEQKDVARGAMPKENFSELVKKQFE